MLGSIIPREGKFFVLFNRLSDLLVQGALEFRELLNDLEHSAVRSKNIKDIEHLADDVTHETVDLLHKTFITPLDRADIHLLITRMDDIIDFIDGASQRVALYDIKKVPPHSVELADICVKSAQHIKSAVTGLEKIKNPAEIVKHCVEVNRLENEADYTLRLAMVQLFKEEKDAIQVIKIKEIYELLDTVTDRCEDVANIVEGIVVEYS